MSILVIVLLLDKRLLDQYSISCSIKHVLCFMMKENISNSLNMFLCFSAEAAPLVFKNNGGLILDSK